MPKIKTTSARTPSVRGKPKPGSLFSGSFTVTNGSDRTPLMSVSADRGTDRSGTELVDSASSVEQTSLITLPSWGAAHAGSFVVPPLPPFQYSTTTYGWLADAVLHPAEDAAQSLSPIPLHSMNSIGFQFPAAASHCFETPGGIPTHASNATDRIPLYSRNVPMWGVTPASRSLEDDESAVATALLDLTPKPPQITPAVNSNSHYSAWEAHGASENMPPPVPQEQEPASFANRRRLLENVSTTTSSCKCKNTHCLKLYCTCFQKGTFCDVLLCVCNQCHNRPEHNVPGGARTEAVIRILALKPQAFEPRPPKKKSLPGSGCTCKSCQ
jgi:Tesmin/TSO1-like CXC domain, cysteine-rich domain